jgi:hypothetical protein
MTLSRLRGFAVLVALLGSAGVTYAPRALAAEEEPQAFARVVVDQTEMRTGPGVSFRSIYTAKRGETFAIDGRQGGGYWLKVLLPDGRVVYVVGEHVQPFAVKPGEEGAPSRPGFFAPPPLSGAHGGFALLGGLLNIQIADKSFRQFGYLEVRPQVVIDRTFTFEGFFGDGLTADGAQLLYGAGATVHLFPSWIVGPFLGLGIGGLSVFPNSDSFVLRREDRFIARAGGGLLFALKGRILVRVEVTNLTLFSADTYRNAQTFSGGLGVYF